MKHYLVSSCEYKYILPQKRPVRPPATESAGSFSRFTWLMTGLRKPHRPNVNTPCLPRGQIPPASASSASSAHVPQLIDSPVWFGPLRLLFKESQIGSLPLSFQKPPKTSGFAVVTSQRVNQHQSRDGSDVRSLPEAGRGGLTRRSFSSPRPRRSRGADPHFRMVPFNPQWERRGGKYLHWP